MEGSQWTAKSYWSRTCIYAHLWTRLATQLYSLGVPLHALSLRTTGAFLTAAPPLHTAENVMQLTQVVYEVASYSTWPAHSPASCLAHPPGSQNITSFLVLSLSFFLSSLPSTQSSLLKSFSGPRRLQKNVDDYCRRCLLLDQPGEGRGGEGAGRC